MPTTLSVSEFARNAAAFAGRILRRRERFILSHDGEPVAEVRPVPPTLRLGDLPELLNNLPPLTDEERAAFADDLDRARQPLNPTAP